MKTAKISLTVKTLINTYTIIPNHQKRTATHNNHLIRHLINFKRASTRKIAKIITRKLEKL